MVSKAPVVIIGMHRSGTTLLSQVLDRSGILMGHDMIAYAESHFFQRCNEQLLQQQNATWDQPKATDQRPAPYNIREHYTRYASLRKHPTGWWPLWLNKRWGWKDPRNTFTLGSWLKLFPNLHAIHICRNGLDVARSLHERNAMLQPKTKWHSPTLTNIQSCFELWEAYVQQAQSWKAVLGKRYTQVRYEDLISEKQETVKALEEFCSRDLHASLFRLTNKERRIKEPLADMEALREKVKSNQTLLRLGYAV